MDRPAGAGTAVLRSRRGPGILPEHPQPLRVIKARAVRGWVERLGAVWVEAQLIEINRRSVPEDDIPDSARQAGRGLGIGSLTDHLGFNWAGDWGATVVARIKPTFYESSGRFIFVCDAITPIGEGRLLARLEQTKRLLRRKRAFRPVT